MDTAEGSWVDDAHAAAFLNEPANQTLCEIGAGLLGEKFAHESDNWNFSRSLLTNGGATALCSLLEQNATLVRLNLASNKIGDSVGTAIANELLSCTGLVHLDLYSCTFGPHTCRLLAETIRVSRTIEVVRLDGNALCVHEIKNAVPRDTRGVVHMSRANLGWRSLVVLSSLLDLNANMKGLDLSNNLLAQEDSAGVEAISTALRYNCCLLTDLDLRFNDFSHAYTNQVWLCEAQ